MQELGLTPRWTVHREGQLVGKFRYVMQGHSRWWLTAFLLPGEVFKTVDTMQEALECIRQLVGSNPVDPNAR